MFELRNIDLRPLRALNVSMTKAVWGHTEVTQIWCVGRGDRVGAYITLTQEA